MRPHEHWHIDVSHINICGTFYFLCSILDGYSRFVIHWEIRETMKEGEVETIVQRAREQFPGERPRIISDNGPQFIAKDFKEFIRICGMTHVRTSFYYPQSNGKMERWYKTLKGGCIRVKTPLSLEDARRLVAEFVGYYNVWAAPHFLVHLKWEFLERLFRSVSNHLLSFDPVLLLSHDALNSVGVA